MFDKACASNRMININKTKKSPKVPDLEISPHLLSAQDLYPLHIGFDLKSNSTKTMGGLYACHCIITSEEVLMAILSISEKFGQQFGSSSPTPDWTHHTPGR